MTATGTGDWPASALQAADTAFAALTCDPDPLTLDCDTLGAELHLPSGAVPLHTLRDWLLEHPRAYPQRDAVWRELIRRARLCGPQWVIAAVGMAMPALSRVAGQLAAGYPGDPIDIDAEVLTGFLEALRDHHDVTRPAPYASLCFAGFRAGRALRLAHQAHVPVEDVESFAAEARTPHRPYGHPDLLVHRAQSLGLIDGDDVPAYIEVRLGRRAIEPIAAQRGMSVDMLRMRLRRADDRLADALATGLLSGVVCVEAAEAIAARSVQRAKIRAGKATARAATPSGVAVAA